MKLSDILRGVTYLLFPGVHIPLSGASEHTLVIVDIFSIEHREMDRAVAYL